MAKGFTQKVIANFEKKNPNVRYVISANRLEEWLMSRYMSRDAVDKSIANVLNG